MEQRGVSDVTQFEEDGDEMLQIEACTALGWRDKIKSGDIFLLVVFGYLCMLHVFPDFLFIMNPLLTGADQVTTQEDIE